MEAFSKVNNVEDLFKELDERKFTNTAQPLAAYRNELMKNGFTRREAMRLVEAYSKFIYDLSLESYIADRRNEEIDAFHDEGDEFDNQSHIDDDDDDDFPELAP